MSARRTERLLNLVICLLATRRWLTKEQIRSAVPQYADCDTPEAFDRMFERDKEDLRELGVPLLTGGDSAWFDDEVGYRIDADAYALPELDLTAEELAVLGLASRVWQQASLAGPAARALVKLRALGVDTDSDSLVGVEPRVRTSEPAFEPLYAATRDRAPVSFRYRKPDGSASTRALEPWRVLSRGRHWYVVGHDRDRGAARAFRISRVEGAVRRTGPAGSYEVPARVDAAAVLGPARQARDERQADLLVRPGRGQFLRRRSEDGAERPSRTESGRPPERSPERSPGTSPDGAWDRVLVRVGDVEELAAQIAGYGPDVRVVGPDDLREAVVRRLRAALDAATGADGPAAGPSPAPAPTAAGGGA